MTFSTKTIDLAMGVELANNSVFSDLRDFGKDFLLVEDFLAALLEIEEQWMEENHSNNPDAKTKKGKWKFRTYLPKAYSSAKSVIKTAIIYGVEIDGLGKSEIQKQIKEEKTTKTDTDDYLVAYDLMSKLKRYRSKITESQWQYLIANLNEV